MGREIKRVDLAFEYPMSEVWVGYLNPFSKLHRTCAFCDSTGLNPASKRISDDWYDFARRGTRWCSDITQDEVDALVKARRLHDFTHNWTNTGWVKKDPEYTPTPQEVNAWNERGFGHDAINRHICVEARCKRLGVWGYCAHCGGNGAIWIQPDPLIALAHEEWQPTEPPLGMGWQVWETVSEGSPVTPVFTTALELIDHLVEGGDEWDRHRCRGGYSEEAAEEFVLRAQHCFSMLTTEGEVFSNIQMCDPLLTG